MALRAATDDESQAMTFNGAVAARPTMRYFIAFARCGVHPHSDESGSADRNRNVHEKHALVTER